MPLTFRETEISGVYYVETSLQSDLRGSFSRLFCEQELEPLLIDRKIVQINRSVTRKVGAIRGLHFQRAPYAEMKLIRCLRGRVWDVALDLRAGSPTFLQWVAEELSSENGGMMVIPEGCAHGFQVLEPDSELLYLHTTAYASDAEGGVMYNDPMLNISWPLPVTELSERDHSHHQLSDGFQGLGL